MLLRKEEGHAMTWLYILIVIGAYLLGSIPTGMIIARRMGVNLRRVGSGNIGATNVTRALGKGWGAVVLLCDILKGLIPVLVSRKVIGSEGWQAEIWLSSTVMAALLGHCFSVFIGFQGGKGVATGFGALVALTPLAAFLALCVWITSFSIYRLSALGAISAAASLPITIFMVYPSRIYLALSLIVAVLIFYTHRENIKRMIEGKEKGFKKRAKAS